MAELLDKYLFLDILESSEENGFKHILARVTYLRTVYTLTATIAKDGSLVAMIYDGYCFNWDDHIFCISNWKYRDLAEPTGPVTEAVWEPSKPWIAEFKHDEQFMCKISYMLKVSVEDECMLITWGAVELNHTSFILDGVIALSASSYDDDKKAVELISELFNKGISLSKVD